MREILAEEGLRQETVRLSAQTRWDSIYLMLKSVSTAKAALQMLQRSQQLPLVPNMADADVVNEIEQVTVRGAFAHCDFMLLHLPVCCVFVCSSFLCKCIVI